MLNPAIRKEGLKYLNDLDSKEINTVVLDKELHSSQQYILYKTAKNDYIKKSSSILLL